MLKCFAQKTEAEIEITNYLKSKKNKVKVFWDMDGTISSMEMQELEHKLESGFFYSKRPIKTTLKVLRRLHRLGAQTFIISFCSYHYQEVDKLKWLQDNCSFLPKENLIIIARKEKDVKKAPSKEALKAEYIRERTSYDEIVYFVDDNESVLLKTKELLPFVRIISPIDLVL